MDRCIQLKGKFRECGYIGCIPLLELNVTEHLVTLSYTCLGLDTYRDE